MVKSALTRNKLLWIFLILILVNALFVGGFLFYIFSIPYNKEVQPRLRELVEAKESFAFSDATNFEWDECVILTPYSTSEAVKSETGKRVPNILFRPVRDTEGQCVLVFYLNDEIVAVSEIQEGVVDIPLDSIIVTPDSIIKNEDTE